MRDSAVRSGLSQGGWRSTATPWQLPSCSASLWIWRSACRSVSRASCRRSHRSTRERHPGTTGPRPLACSTTARRTMAASLGSRTATCLLTCRCSTLCGARANVPLLLRKQVGRVYMAFVSFALGSWACRTLLCYMMQLSNLTTQMHHPAKRKREEVRKRDEKYIE